MSRKGNLLGSDAGLIARKGERKEGSLCRRGSACSIVLRKFWPCQWGVPEPNGLLQESCMLQGLCCALSLTGSITAVAWHMQWGI